MEPVWRSKEKEYTLHLGARDRQSTSCVSCGPFCVGFCLQCSVTCGCVRSSALLPPSACLPPRGWRDPCWLAPPWHGILWQRLPATRTPGTQQFHHPWELVLCCRPGKWLLVYCTWSLCAQNCVMLGTPAKQLPLASVFPTVVLCVLVV